MKKLCFFLILMLPVVCFGQYKASNGVTYNVGDTITIGNGSATNGSFLYIQMNGLMVVSEGSHNLDQQYSGLKAVIKKVVMKKLAGQVKPCFTIQLSPFSYIVYIESAIKSGEIR